MDILEIERRIAQINGELLPKGTAIVAQARDAFLEAKRAYKLALAEQRQDIQGSRVDREDKALIATADLWRQMDTAEVAMKRAEDIKSDLRDELSGLQTRTKLFEKSYQTAGRGEY